MAKAIVFLQAVGLWQKRGHNSGECRQLMASLQQYAVGSAPYDMPTPHPLDVRAWWGSVRSQDNAAIVGLAQLLLDVVPHAADPERVFSAMGWFQSARRNRMGQEMLTMMTAVKQHHDQQRKPKQQQKETRAVEGDVVWVTSEAALAAAESALSIGGGPAAAADDELDLVTATPEELERVLLQLYAAEAEQQVADGHMSYTELLTTAWPGIDIMSPQLDPSCDGNHQLRTPMARTLGDGSGTDFNVQQLVAEYM